MTQRIVHRRRCLWMEEDPAAAAPNNNMESFDEIYSRFATQPSRRRSLFWLCASAAAMVQEFALTCYVLALVQIYSILETEEGAFSQRSYLDASTACILAALLLTVVWSSVADPTMQQDRTTKLVHRSTDSLLLAVLLRFISSILQSLTASYSTDTVEALAGWGMLVHVLLCDYSYANGRSSTLAAPIRSNCTTNNSERPPFLGGTVSLNAALFSTTLLVSRIQDHATAYVLVSLAIVVFAFYPATRHAIAVSYPAHSSGTCVLTN
jgi:Phosphatidylinositol N-acetylglucosaminyltransferase